MNPKPKKNTPKSEGGKKEKYWIFKTVYFCPLCGEEQVYRERKTTPKPKDYNKRNKLIEDYDYCDVL